MFNANKLERVTLPENLPWSTAEFRDTFGARVEYAYMCNDRKAGTYTVDKHWNEYRRARAADDCRYVDTDYGLAILEYTGDANHAAIPEQIGGRPVKYIKGLKKGITGVRIPNGVTAIGDEAFKGLSLSSVDIPDSVTYIGRFAFSGCGLTGVTLGSGVVYIGGGAFYDNQLTSVTIPDSVKIIADGVKSALWHGAFSRNKLTSVALGSGVTYIGRFAFSENQLTSVTIPGSVTTIGEEAFYDNRLTSVTIPSSVTTIGHKAFSSNQLTSVAIQDNVTTIGERAFYDNQLTSVTLGESVICIGSDAFAYDLIIVYNRGGKMAGTYVYANNTWRRRTR